ncbi:hypothetical protein BM525_19355 (plasmid) [Alteromonas mediterranea]|nr:class I SAM-dependent methyltransferase [Alteromonas mediterranea]APD99895.1 hypothetical protein BM525_19355 [Alteromonas mediterranea]
MNSLQTRQSTYISPFVKSVTGGASLSVSSLSQRIEKRDSEARLLETAIVSLNASKGAAGMVLDVFMNERYPHSLPGSVEHSSTMIAKKNGYQEAISDLTNKEIDIKKALSRLDAKYWRALIQSSEVDSAMSGKQQDEWRLMLEKGDVPAFDMETVTATLMSWNMLRAEAFVDRIIAVWDAVSKEHVSNANSHFQKSFILSDCKYPHEVLNELRSVVSIIEGKEPMSRDRMGSNQLLNDVERLGRFGQWIWVDGNALAIKFHKKGTLHAKVNAVVAAKMNDVLAMRFMDAIPGPSRDVKRASRKENAEVIQSKEDCLAFNDVEALGNIVRAHSSHTIRALRQKGFCKENIGYLYNTSNENRTPVVLDVMEWLGAESIEVGGEHLCWRSDVDIFDVLAEIRIRGALPNVKSYQFYPSKGQIGERAADIFWSHVEDAESKRYCEPNGGHGDLAQYLPKDRTKVVELSPVNAAILKAKGFDVHCGDFLSLPNTEASQFDGILMNPPFHDGAAFAHVTEALTRLRAGGVLVAIVPSSARARVQKAWGMCAHITHTETISEAFAGVNVSVEIMTVIVNE